MVFLAKGKRGIVHLVKKGDIRLVVKEKNPESKADSLKNESFFLELLNKHNIGPRFYSFRNNRLYMEYVEGERIIDFFEKADKKQIISMLKKILKQLYRMDKLGINKFELTNPYKHILVTEKLKPVMIDFERCRYTKKPKNITQFLQFLSKDKILGIFNKKGINFTKSKILGLAKDYKKGLDVRPLLECL